MGALVIHGADDEARRFVEEWEDGGAYVTAHTSGSTGAPKTIRLPKADMRVSARATCRHFGIGASSRLVSPLSASYIAGKMMIVRAIESGASLTMLPPSRALDGLDAVDGDIDLLAVVPAQIDGLLRSHAVGRVRNVIVGGAPLSADAEAELVSAGVRAYATYGMTETCSHVALRRIGDGEEYTAMPDVLFDTDADGCLVIEARHYSARRFVTNDVVRLVDDRHFIWLGRRDNVINSGGIKIVPERVEEMLRPYIGGADFYLTSRPSDVWGQEMVMVVATHGRDMDIGGALALAAEALPHHLMPKAVVYVDEHTYTSTGKIKRSPG